VVLVSAAVVGTAGTAADPEAQAMGDSKTSLSQYGGGGKVSKGGCRELVVAVIKRS
jgi:hypothetical protein